MNYIYDIYLNFNNKIIDFFDWNKNDKLTHLKKVPIIKIDNNTFNIFYSNRFKLNLNVLNNIKYRTEEWKKKNTVKYCVLFCTNTSILCVIFDNKGISFKKSVLLVDEELEILDLVSKFKEKKVNYVILNKEKTLFKTRKQIEKEKFINKKLLNINDDKLKYIYYECFNKTNNKDRMILDIKNMNRNSKEYENLYNILKLISSIKK